MSDLIPLRPPFSRRAEVDALCKRYIATPIGQMLYYHQIKDVISTDPQSTAGRTITDRARTIVQREESVVMECIRNEGFLRASDSVKVVISSHGVRKVRNAVKKGQKVIKAIQAQNLAKEEMHQYTVNIAIYGALNQATRPKILKDIERAIDASSTINCGEVLQLMSKGTVKT